MITKAFREIPAPVRKADYVGCHLFLRADPPDDPWADRIWKDLKRPYRKTRAAKGDVVQIVRRLNAKDTCNCSRDVYSWGKIRILDVSFDCSTCGMIHRDYIPESYIEEGKAVFVELYVKGEEDGEL